MSGRSFVRNVVHIVFSTKYRQPLIDADIEEELHRYLGGVCNNLGSPVIKVGGYVDHVHILCSLSKRLALMDLLEEMKAHSSKWVKTKGKSYQNFYWQSGYGAFSVNPDEVDVVRTYIENQHAHHGSRSFQQEFRDYLDRYEIEYDERYIWL